MDVEAFTTDAHQMRRRLRLLPGTPHSVWRSFTLEWELGYDVYVALTNPAYYAEDQDMIRASNRPRRRTILLP